MTREPSGDVLSQIRLHGVVPRHVAIIMDGNGRWAKRRHMPRSFGHRSGMKAVRDVVEGAVEVGLEYLSLFAFSRENWERPETEVTALMSLLEEYIESEADELHAQGVQVRALGDLSRLRDSAAAAVARVVERTSGNRRLVFNLFISYSAREELVRAARDIARAARSGELAPDDVDEEAIRRRLYTHDCPDPDLLIRTSGEHRISNFLLWQAAYSELYLSPVLWPDFTRGHLYEAIRDFQRRERRFGRVMA